MQLYRSASEECRVCASFPGSSRIISKSLVTYSIDQSSARDLSSGSMYARRGVPLVSRIGPPVEDERVSELASGLIRVRCLDGDAAKFTGIEGCLPKKSSPRASTPTRRGFAHGNAWRSWSRRLTGRACVRNQRLVGPSWGFRSARRAERAQSKPSHPHVSTRATRLRLLGRKIKLLVM